MLSSMNHIRGGLRPMTWCLIVSGALLGLLCGCGPRQTPAITAPLVLHRGLGGEPGSLDPARVDKYYELLDALEENCKDLIDAETQRQQTVTEHGSPWLTRPLLSATPEELSTVLKELEVAAGELKQQNASAF